MTTNGKPALRLNVMFAHFPYSGNGGVSSEIPQIRRWEVETALKILKDPRIDKFHSKDFSDTPITMTRNKAVQIAKADGAHLLLMIDSDNDPLKHVGEPWFKPFWDEAFDFIYKNYGKGPHVVGAPYCGPPDGTENVYVFQWDTNGNKEDETAYSLEAYSRAQASQMAGIQECAALPTGMILIDLRACDLIEPVKQDKRAVLEQVQAGTMSVEDALYGLKEGYFYYEWKDQRADEKASTEDVTFTRDIALAGMAKLGYNPVHCAWDSWVGHHKPWNVGKPRHYSTAHISSTFGKAWEAGHRDNEAIVDLSRFNQGDDPLSRRIREMVLDQRGYTPDVRVLAESNGHSQNGHSSNGHKVNLDQRNHVASPDVVEYVSQFCSGLVVDIGPGRAPFPHATEFVGRKQEGIDYGQPFHELDLSCDRLPYADKSVDFIHCRHVLEDIDNPNWLLTEIRRVAKAGYIETPSPIAECCKGVGVPDCPVDLRGYPHHRSLVWTTAGMLFVLPKYPAIDQLENVEHADLLNQGVKYWNTYHLWQGDLEFQCLRHERDFLIGRDRRYDNWVQSACAASQASTDDFLKAMAVQKRNSNGAPLKMLGTECEETTSPDMLTGRWKDHGHAPEYQQKVLQDLVRAAAYRRNGQARVLEVGSWLGKTAIAMASAAKSVVHCVDTWEGSPTDVTSVLAAEAGGGDKVYEEFCANVGERLNKTIVPWRMSSAKAAAMHWTPFDVMFIDAEHTYEAVKEDILGWWKHLADDGVMVGHDYETHGHDGVVRAVEEIFGDKVDTCGWHIQGCMWIVRKRDFPDGLPVKEECDVAQANH